MQILRRGRKLLRRGINNKDNPRDVGAGEFLDREMAELCVAGGVEEQKLFGFLVGGVGGGAVFG